MKYRELKVSYCVCVYTCVLYVHVCMYVFEYCVCVCLYMYVCGGACMYTSVWVSVKYTYIL